MRTIEKGDEKLVKIEILDVYTDREDEKKNVEIESKRNETHL